MRLGAVVAVLAWSSLMAFLEMRWRSEHRHRVSSLVLGMKIQLVFVYAVYACAALIDGFILFLLYFPVLLVVVLVGGITFGPRHDEASVVVQFLAAFGLSLACGTCHLALAAFLGAMFSPIEKTKPGGSALRPLKEPEGRRSA
jgi:hypothetical protein